jgi:hypothetical protein
MGSCRCDRSHRESQLDRIDPVTQPLRAEFHGLAATESATDHLAAVRGPARSGTNVAVKIPGRERYVTDSKTAAKPSSGFTVHHVSSDSDPVFGENVANKGNRVVKFLLAQRCRPCWVGTRMNENARDPRSGARAGGRGFKFVK